MDASGWGTGVTLVAGPERLPLSAVMERHGAAELPVLVIGASPPPLDMLSRGRVSFGGLDRLRPWLEGVEGGALVVIEGVDALRPVGPGELPEAVLLSLIEAHPLRADASLVIVEPMPLDRLTSPSEAMKALLARVDRARLWTGAELLDAAEVLRTGSHPALPSDAFAPEWRLYAVIAAACTLAVAVAFRPSLLGSYRGDALLGDVREGLSRALWLNAWVGERIAEGGSWNDTARIYWPLGAEVMGIFGNLGAALLAQPFQALLGFPAYWNVYLGAALVANGLAMGWLARTLGADRPGAVLGALAFCLAPPLLREIDRGAPEVLWAAPLLLAIGFGIRAVEGRRRHAVAAGLAAAVAGLIWWFYALFAAVVVVAVGAVRARREPARRGQLLGQLGLAMKVWLPSLVGAIPVIAAANRGHLPDLDELYLPGDAGPSFGAALVFQRMTGDVLALDRLLAVPSASAGWLASLLVFALVGLWIVAARGRRLFWPALSLVFAVLALGPWLSPDWGLADGWLPLPLRALQVLFPPLTALDRPDRLLVVAAVGLAVTLALCWAPLSLRVPAPLRSAALGGAVVGVAAMPLLSGAVPLGAFDYAPPAWVERLDGEGALIHVPLGWSESSLLWQPLHGLDVTGGPDEVRAMRDPSPYRTAFEESPALAFFHELPRGRMNDADRDWLRERGARWIVVHVGFMRQLMRASTGPEADAIEPFLDRIDVAFGPPVVETEDVRLYQVR